MLLYILLAILVIMYISRDYLDSKHTFCVKGSGSDAVCNKGCEWIDRETRWNGEAGTATICSCQYCKECEFKDGHCINKGGSAPKKEEVHFQETTRVAKDTKTVETPKNLNIQPVEEKEEKSGFCVVM
jgi:hypothetical protein